MGYLSIFYACKERYDPPLLQTNSNYLVVDGFLNNSQDSTFIRISRTRRLDSNLLNSGETNAQVTIEDNGGNILYSLQEIKRDGMYTLPGMNLDINNTYRLRIKTTTGREYLSDEIKVKQTPPIDSISWAKSDRGVTIYSNAHDVSGNTRYYRWEYIETWQYHSPYISRLKYDSASLGFGLLASRPDSEFIYTCWQTKNSRELLMATTAKLSEDIISLNPLRFIPTNAEELSVKYSILLKQYALTKESFEYLQNLRKNTEQTGSIFDAQPSELTSNIHALNKTNEIVLGFVTACNMDSKRIYITNGQVSPWISGSSCNRFLVPRNTDSIELYFRLLGNIPIEFYNSSLISPVWGTVKDCGDCRVKGGTTTKPDFWQ